MHTLSLEWKVAIATTRSSLQSTLQLDSPQPRPTLQTDITVTSHKRRGVWNHCLFKQFVPSENERNTKDPHFLRELTIPGGKKAPTRNTGSIFMPWRRHSIRKYFKTGTILTSHKAVQYNTTSRTTQQQGWDILRIWAHRRTVRRLKGTSTRGPFY